MLRKYLLNICVKNSFCSTKMLNFTDFYSRKLAEDNNQQVSTGRSWKAEELRLKSTEDLQKLWHLLLIEKNLLISDNHLKRKIHQSLGAQGRLSKVRVTMARLLTIVNERKIICDEYRQKLENDYVDEQRKIYMEQKMIQEKEEIKVPEINQNLMRAKYSALKRGIDNTDYIEKTLDIAERKRLLKEQLDIKYSKKQQKFKQSFQLQLDQGIQKISQDEVLRQHVKNWRQLNLSQRKTVLGFLNARRSKQAKSIFLQELNLLSQKIAYDNAQC